MLRAAAQACRRTEVGGLDGGAGGMTERMADTMSVTTHAPGHEPGHDAGKRTHLTAPLAMRGDRTRRALQPATLALGMHRPAVAAAMTHRVGLAEAHHNELWAVLRLARGGRLVVALLRLRIWSIEHHSPPESHPDSWRPIGTGNCNTIGRIRNSRG